MQNMYPASEVDALKFQLAVGAKIGLTASEKTWLKELIANPKKLDPWYYGVR